MATTEVPKRVLVPVDLSTRSEVGIGYGAMLAEATDADLVVMTNVNAAEQAILEEFARVEHVSLPEAGHASLHRMVARLVPSTKVEIDVRFRDDPAVGILDSADDCEADVIVICSHGRGGMSKWLLGSVAEKVVRASPIPVVVVPARD